MSNDWWTFGESAAQDQYFADEPRAKITVRPRVPFELPPEAMTDEDRRLAEYAASLVKPPRRDEPSPIEPSIYDTQQFTMRSPQPAPPREMGAGPEARSFEPTQRQRAAQRLLGDAPSASRQRMVSMALGTTGIGESGLGIADFVPGLGSWLGAQEEAQKGDYQMAAVAAMPGGKPARKAMKAIEAAAREVVAPAKKPERVTGFAPGSVLDPAVAPAPKLPTPPLPPGNLAEPYLRNPLRIYKPGIYKDPRVIAREAAERTAPEHPAMKALFGVTRDDLWEIGQRGTRKGNVDPNTVIWQPSKGGTSYAADAVMTPANAQRQIDVMAEAQKYPELAKGMESWYVMDPLFHRMVQLVGKEQAIKDYRKLNATVTPFSSNSDVMTELNRGTAANMMANRGEFDQFVKYGGMPVADRPRDFPSAMADVKPHLRHGMHVQPVGRYLETGAHGFDKNTVKNPLYSLASGVPETGFQTSLPVPDAHLARAVGYPDVRDTADPGKFLGGPEYRPFGPWYRENVAKPMGLEAVPAQGLEWGAFGPQTGVKTEIGAPKLELLSQLIWERAAKLGIDPKVLRDEILRGKAHASWLLPAMVMGGVAAQDRYND